MGEAARALGYHRQALQVLEALSSSDPKDAQTRGDLAATYDHLGEALAKAGHTLEASGKHRQAIEIFEAISSADPANAELRRALAAAHVRLGRACLALASRAKAPMSERAASAREARSHLQRGLSLWLELRKQGVSLGPGAEAPDRISGEIARCDQVLARLKASD
jgi:tetratricopeptide (TPR) repeat protein